MIGLSLNKRNTTTATLNSLYMHMPLRLSVFRIPSISFLYAQYHPSLKPEIAPSIAPDRHLRAGQQKQKCSLFVPLPLRLMLTKLFSFPSVVLCPVCSPDLAKRRAHICLAAQALASWRTRIRRTLAAIIQKGVTLGFMPFLPLFYERALSGTLRPFQR